MTKKYLPLSALPLSTYTIDHSPLTIRHLYSGITSCSAESSLSQYCHFCINNQGCSKKAVPDDWTGRMFLSRVTADKH